jgi:hypothetical protein
VVDAKDDASRDFYLHHGFTLFPLHNSRLFILMDTIGRMLSQIGLG